MMKNITNERIVFTKEMKKTHTILLPMMLMIHFKLLENVFKNAGYKVELLETTHKNIVDEGLKSVHNDTCYPALLVIGQFIDALKSGKYDVDKTALLITQTGGGCRASNYIHLLRKALNKNGLGHVPVVSLNLSGLEKNPGFKITLPLVKNMVYSCFYGDILMAARNKIMPYEQNEGDAQRLCDHWINKLTDEMKNNKRQSYQAVKSNFNAILKDFSNIPILKTEKVKVGIVGEIYIKYSPLGNNDLENFLMNEGAEVIVPGLMDFIIFKIDNRLVDIRLYGGKWLKKFVVGLFKKFSIKVQNDMYQAFEKSGYGDMMPFEGIKQLVQDYVGHGNKMGEGWLLTAEMLELVHSGVNNVVCAQPFGCLPNHIVGKGMIRKIKDNHPEANIVAIDYDPGTSRVNQQNRIKLMLANAKKYHRIAT